VVLVLMQVVLDVGLVVPVPVVLVVAPAAQAKDVVRALADQKIAVLADQKIAVLADQNIAALADQNIAAREGPSAAPAQVDLKVVDPLALKVVDPLALKVVVLMDKHTIRCTWLIMRWSSMPIRTVNLIGTNCSSSLGTCLAQANKVPEDQEDQEQVDPMRVDPVTLVAVGPVAQKAVDPVVVEDLAVPRADRRVVDHNDHSDLSNPQPR